MSTRGLILEGLHDSRVINEEASVFASKLNKFLQGVSKDKADFIKKALNNLYLGLKKDYTGYIEGKRPTIKEYNSYRIMFWKIQTKESTHYDFYNFLKKYWKPLGKAITSVDIDGNRYECVCMDFEDFDDAEFTSSRKFRNEFDLGKNVVIGVDSVADTKFNTAQSLDKSVNGDTFRIIISVPEDIMVAEVSNPYITKKGQKYVIDNGNEFSVNYDEGKGEFTTYRGKGYGDLFCVIYKKSANAAKAFKEIVSILDKNTTYGDIENIIEKNKIRISTSYYPGID